MNSTKNYRFLPFRFERRKNSYLLVNDTREYVFINEKEFFDFIQKKLESNSQTFLDLKSKGMLYDGHIKEVIELQATKYRTKKRFLDDFTSLHMFVLTYRCNQKCSYCHASSVDENNSSIPDMSFNTARKCVDLVFMSPSPYIKIEFQGGEPLLNFDTLKEIVEYAEEVNKIKNKHLEFVVCTNLLCINQDILDFLKAKKVCVSTSLDGPKDIHNACRVLHSKAGSYDIVKSNLSWSMAELGKENISALMTVTNYNLNRLQEVVDEYLERGLGSIFLRNINPFGMALKNKNELLYNIEDFVNNYKTALEYIIQLNLSGIHFPEAFITILLTRILTPFSTGFMDLQSPTGAGISGVIYETNGDVFVSDEARMLFRASGNKKFCIGNVFKNSWHEIFGGQLLREIISDSCIESIPGCAWCVYQTYCGADPVKNYSQYGSLENRPNSEFCKNNKQIFNILFDYLEQGDSKVLDVFWSWITSRSLEEVRGQIPLEAIQ